MVSKKEVAKRICAAFNIDDPANDYQYMTIDLTDRQVYREEW